MVKNVVPEAFVSLLLNNRIIFNTYNNKNLYIQII